MSGQVPLLLTVMIRLLLISNITQSLLCLSANVDCLPTNEHGGRVDVVTRCFEQSADLILFGKKKTTKAAAVKFYNFFLSRFFLKIQRDF